MTKMTAAGNDFDLYFHDFMAKAFGYPLPRPSFGGIGWAGLAPERVEAVSANFRNAVLPDILSWATKKSLQEGAARQEERTARASALAEQVRGLAPNHIRKAYDIQRKDYAEHDFERDLLHVKINHGFWEQLFVIHNDGYDEEIMRPTTKRGYLMSYGASRFQEALLLAAAATHGPGAAPLSFPGVDFGFSFGSGDIWHDTWLNRYPEAEPLQDPIPKGVYAGSQLFFSELGLVPGRQLSLVDGAFAKQALWSGHLDTLLQRTAELSDAVVFCVPPQLHDVRLRAVDNSRQSTLLVSGRLVHHAWPMTLSEVSRPLLERLARGETVTVMVQAAVFSALLGLYLHNAKRDLGLSGRLFYLDLGQVLDVAKPDQGGPWVKRRLQDMMGGASDAVLPFHVQPA